MTLDMLEQKSDKIVFLQRKISDISPAKCNGVCIFTPDAPCLLDDYIYILQENALPIPEILYQKHNSIFLFPASLGAQLTPDDFSCDLAVFDDSLCTPQQLLTEIAALLAREMQVERFKLKLADLLLMDADVPAILSFSGVALENPIYVLSSSSHLLFQWGLTDELAARDPVIADLLSAQAITPAIYSRYGFSRLRNTLLQTLEPFVTETPGLLPRIYFRIMDRRAYLAHIVLLGANRPLTAADREMVKALAHVLTLKLRDPVGSKAALYHENLLGGLLDGSITTPEQLSAFHFDYKDFFHKGYRLLVMELDQATSRTEDASGNYLLMSRHHLTEHFPTILHTCRIHQYIAALISEACAPQILEALPQFLRTYGLLGSISNQIFDPFSLSGYYRQCVELLSFCADDLDGEGSRLASFSQCYCNLLLKTMRDRCQGLEYILPEWVRLLHYDRQHNTDYVQTLFAYLSHSGILQTTQQLHVHKNTLIYRLEKIRELTGCDLSDEEKRHQLYLSFLLFQDIQQSKGTFLSFSGIDFTT